MSGSTVIGVGPGISTELAEAARAEIDARIRARSIQYDKERPITFVSHEDHTREAANDFLESGDKTTVADILKIRASEVRKRFKGARPGIVNTPEHIVESGRSDCAYTILALGDLSSENGLPALGSSGEQFTLKSGEALHFIGDLQQKYSDKGGGFLIWYNWNNLRNS